MRIKREILERVIACNFIYKKITDNLYLCRMYGCKELHPIGYHIIFPLIIID